MSWDWDALRSGPRRANPQGIATKRRSGAIGATWWSKRFVAALEGITNPSRLARGRSYARSGQVSHLVVAPGQVSARVQGSRPRPYDVQLTLVVFDDAQWAQIEGVIVSQALFAAALLAGEMPRELEQVIADAGLSVFPRTTAELRTRCSCPDAANPCKHVAATYYVLAEHFDEDPFAMLAWRGRDREALVAGLRKRRADAAMAAEAESPEPSAEPRPLEGFWEAAPAALAHTLDRADPAPPDALLRHLGPLGGPADPSERLVRLVERIAEAALARTGASADEV